MVLNTITDLYLMAIPLPVSPYLTPCRATMLKPACQVIYKSRLNTSKKIFLIALFSGGFLTMAFGILRCVTLVTVCAYSEQNLLRSC